MQGVVRDGRQDTTIEHVGPRASCVRVSGGLAAVVPIGDLSVELNKCERSYSGDQLMFGSQLQVKL